MCGIIGVSGIPDAARLAYLGLYALQHRGQESAGIVARGRRGHGPLAPRHGTGVGELRRGDPAPACPVTSRWATPATPPPAARCSPTPSPAASTPAAARWPSPTTATSSTPTRSSASWSSAAPSSPRSTDTEVLVHLIARSEADTVEDQIRDALEQVDGAYSLVITVGRTMYAVVDSRGFRPLVLGTAGRRAWWWPRRPARSTWWAPPRSASSSRASSSGSRTARSTELPRLAPRPVSRCVFELVYFARPDSTVFGESVDRVRRELGRQLAREQPAPGGEVVFSVPDSSNAMALGFSRGVRDQAGVRPDPEPLRRPDVHQPDAGAPGGQGQDQVQPGARRHPRQVGGGGGRQPGPRQHQQGAWCR